MTDVASSRSIPRKALEEGVQKIGDAGHEAALTAVGLAFLGVEGAQQLWRNRDEVLDMAQTRGVDVESDAVAYVRRAEERFHEQVNTLRSVRNRAKSPRGFITQLASTLRDRVDAELAQHEVGCTVVGSQEIEITVGEDGQHKPGTAAPAKGDGLAAFATGDSNPFRNYDEMSAKEIISQLSSLSADELTSILEYERQKGKRVTVLRAVEHRLAEI